ncbi:MAG: DNA/RNA non-specific endonuclease, partial [Gemmataceae bacterium]|nr:DNA/RNA non-specific endonuclease [Gemmataceae bacterium]
MRARFASFAVVLAALLGGTLAGARPVPDTGLPPKSIHMALGNPSAAKSDGADKTNFLMRKTYFALSYNNAKGTPNWVSWYLSAEFLGKAKRKPSFDPDDELLDGFTRITHRDYTNSGFQRGHMCPHSDRAADQDMSFATFVMTNVVPQSAECNEGSWESLEAYCRYLVKVKGKELFVVAGPIGKGGEGEHGVKQT